MKPIMTCSPPAHLWIDLDNAHSVIDQASASGKISLIEAEQLSSFKENGYVIFPGLFGHDQVDSLRDELSKIYLQPERYLMRMPKGDVIHPDAERCPPKSRLLDYYVQSELARNMVLAKPITRFLNLVYNEPPLAFQSLLFTWGTEHSIHVDNSYIVCAPACSLMASWIALEDVVPGAGELAYYPGSHRQPLFLFGEGRIGWRRNQDKKLIHAAYTDFLKERADAGSQPVQYFHARKGDIMVWHSNLVHYGTDIKLENQTRVSLLTHYCPAEHGTPNYFNFFPAALKKSWNDGFYSSRRYDLGQNHGDLLPVYKK